MIVFSLSPLRILSSFLWLSLTKTTNDLIGIDSRVSSSLRMKGKISLPLCASLFCVFFHVSHNFLFSDFDSFSIDIDWRIKSKNSSSDSSQFVSWMLSHFSSREKQHAFHFVCLTLLSVLLFPWDEAWDNVCRKQNEDAWETVYRVTSPEGRTRFRRTIVHFFRLSTVLVLLQPHLVPTCFMLPNRTWP